MSFHTFRSGKQQWNKTGEGPVIPKAYTFGYILE